MSVHVDSTGEKQPCRYCGRPIGSGWNAQSNPHLERHERVCARKSDRERKFYAREGRWPSSHTRRL